MGPKEIKVFGSIEDKPGSDVDVIVNLEEEDHYLT